MSVAPHPLVSVVARRPAPAIDRSTGWVSRELHARLTAEDVAAVESRLEGDLRTAWDGSSPAARQRLAVVFGVHLGIPGVLERTGLLDVAPPEDVHAMARGPFAAGGDLYTADVVADTLDAIGFRFTPGVRVLDFGCSSGRVLRALAAWRPDLVYSGCDPNHDAVAWADAHLPFARFFPSETTPPVDLPDASLELAFAISIWSHYAEAPALEWLEEMRRVLVPGGLLLITTHGWDALARGTRENLIAPNSVADAAYSMITHGHHFIDVFGEDGDWGVDKTGWGNAYCTVDWLTARLQGRWAVRAHVPGGLDHFQDVTVLQRVA